MNRRSFLRNSALMSAGLAFPGMLSFIEYRRAHARQQPLRAAFSSGGLAGTWNAQGQEAALYMADLLGVEITWFDGEFNPSVQRNKVDQMATEQWDFVAIQPGSIDVLIEPVTTMINNGIPFIDMDVLVAPLGQLPEMGVLTFIAPDNVFMSESVVKKLVEKMEGAGKIFHIGGEPGHTGAQARRQGFYNIVNQYPDIEVVDDQPANWNVTRAAEVTEAVLNGHPDLKAIFADNDDMALAAAQIVENAGLSGQVLIGGVDAMSPAIQAVYEGRLVATARNSASRIHAWSVVVGAYAATIGLEQARQEIPSFILADGPAIYADIDTNPELAEEPWKLRSYGLSTAPGQIWAQDNFFLF
jgi:ribose transport system substrate-binding protein